MKKIILLLFAAVAIPGMAIMPVVVSAQSVSASMSDLSTINTLEAQINALLSQLGNLRAQLNVAIGSSTPSVSWVSPAVPMSPASSTASGAMPMCPAFNRNLSIGEQGSDVMMLQSMLAQDTNFPQADITGYFGPITAKALANFQVMNGITSSSSATGFFGPLTRAFFGKRCLQLPGSNGGTMPRPSGTPPIYNGGPANGSTSAMISPSSGPVGTSVTISGIASASSSDLGATETVLMDGLAAEQNVSVAADGSVTFTVPSSLAPNCGPVHEICPQFMMLTSPRSYQVSLVGQDGVSSSTMPIQVGIFTVTGNGSSTIGSLVLPL
jgi:peptidoglycan hydrolase-like protein with peptidoglycan-binding domain